MTQRSQALPDFMRTRMEYNTCMQDVRDLRDNYEFIPFFTYGCEKYNFSDYDILQHAPRYGTGRTAGGQFSMLLCEQNFPVVLYEGEAEHCGHIRGEIFLVTPDIIHDLDVAHSQGELFRRVRRPIVYHDPGAMGADIKLRYALCHMYLGESSYWMPQRLKGKAKNKAVSYAGSKAYGGEAVMSQYYSFNWDDDAPNRQDRIPF